MTEATVVSSRDRFHTVAANSAQNARVPAGLRTAVAAPDDAYRRARWEPDGEGVFGWLPDGIRVGPFHSLAVERSSITDSLIQRGSTENKSTVMSAIRQLDPPSINVQFRPERLLTGDGKAMVRNGLALCRRWEQ
ncbi:MAG: hypothetical protein V5A38_12450 [Halolamina sp.]|uniref:glutamine amidotransferase-related protein n=1 Tax=Halolamina sp. TaxID=1940283 RepID=UPI002FC2FAEC